MKKQKPILLIGGYPKGYDKPFHPNTFSGKRLRKILDKSNNRFELGDLWENARQERNARIDARNIAIIRQYLVNGWRVIALGKHVYESLKNHGIQVEYLPHPASRRKSDLIKLKNGLLKIQNIEE